MYVRTCACWKSETCAHACVHACMRMYAHVRVHAIVHAGMSACVRTTVDVVSWEGCSRVINSRMHGAL